jgi:hypothetical protein
VPVTMFLLPFGDLSFHSGLGFVAEMLFGENARP